jgi:hypothetical protein
MFPSQDTNFEGILTRQYNTAARIPPQRRGVSGLMLSTDEQGRVVEFAAPGGDEPVSVSGD